DPGYQMCPEDQPFVLKAHPVPQSNNVGVQKTGCPARYRYIRLIAKIITLRNLPAILEVYVRIIQGYGEITGEQNLRTNKEHSLHSRQQQADCSQTPIQSGSQI